MTPAINDQLHAYADQVGTAAASAVDRVWSELWAGMKPGPAAAAQNYQRALQVLNRLPQQLHAGLWGGMAGLLHWSYGEAGRALLGQIPLEKLWRLDAQRR